mgnify:CR=1 FL=1
MPIESDEEWAMVQEVLNTFIDDEAISMPKSDQRG